MSTLKGIAYTAAVVLAVIVLDKKFQLSDRVAAMLPGGK